MEGKLLDSQDVFAGLTRGDFDQIQVNARRMQVSHLLEQWSRDRQLTRNSDYEAQANVYDFAVKELIRSSQRKDIHQALELTLGSRSPVFDATNSFAMGPGPGTTVNGGLAMPDFDAAAIVRGLIEEHQLLRSRIEEERKWWAEVREYGTPRFGEMGIRLAQLRRRLRLTLNMRSPRP